MFGDCCQVSLTTLSTLEIDMKPLARHGVSKGKSARKFRAQVGTVKAANMAIGPMRGGWRL